MDHVHNHLAFRQQTNFQLSCLFFLFAVAGCSNANTDHRSYAERVENLGGTVRVHLDFSGSEITDDELLSLDLPETVFSISLRETPITNEGIAALVKVTNLENLNLQHTQITDAAEDTFKQMPRLWRVNPDCENVSLEAFNRIVLTSREKQKTLSDRKIYQQIPRLSSVAVE